MEIYNANGNYKAGDIVYVIYRNPHTQDVANVQQAAVIHDPENPGALAVFLYETYYPLTAEMAVYTTESEANEAYSYYFGGTVEESFQ
ncbi:transcriptional regulator SplA domain-containing protein [Paenibacillus senegalimassiliensis]|uniref:transcriptional regulator SplA domain-containing protein n=1 Tax=Paenibacillus senegalimassiliensis TaxID=1737426 RepID=UPI00073F7E7C|nr:transcriptional regulator SplA domain-containing protein [Paenibacillus senegalimassiliensis]